MHTSKKFYSPKRNFDHNTYQSNHKISLTSITKEKFGNVTVGFNIVNER